MQNISDHIYFLLFFSPFFFWPNLPTTKLHLKIQILWLLILLCCILLLYCVSQWWVDERNLNANYPEQVQPWQTFLCHDLLGSAWNFNSLTWFGLYNFQVFAQSLLAHTSKVMNIRAADYLIRCESRKKELNARFECYLRGWWCFTLYFNFLSTVIDYLFIWFCAAFIKILMTWLYNFFHLWILKACGFYLIRSPSGMLGLVFLSYIFSLILSRNVKFHPSYAPNFLTASQEFCR